MFGRPPQNNNGRSSQARPTAAEMALIQGGGLVQIIVTNLAPLTYFLFLNDTEVSQMDVESLSIFIEAPQGAGDAGTIRATLARYMPSVTGARTLQRTELFPCTLELIALQRRLSITAMHADSFDGLWISLGLKPNGESFELEGLKGLTVLINETILHAKLTWQDGETEDLLPQ
jgi:hypothetical protein